MHLKKLELCGFKSFADRTQIFFDKGVTCVVGPNGCGKSNISDSIRWVLGERKAKLLRGSKMEDVIFAGTQFRKPVSFAEVSLTIDNEDRGLPIDYNEVTITRRLHRSGESEYLINKTQCRLKDVQDLILDTGIGSNSYSMIEQGRIDHILNADANERRFLIEEAAGISKYKVKKEEAVRKLERTEQNLLRLHDIVAEVQRNIAYAERQAKKAQKYKEQYEELKDLETRNAFYEISKIDERKQAILDSTNQTNQQIEEMKSLIEDFKKQLFEKDEEFKIIGAQYSEEEGKRYGVKAKIEKNEQQLQFNQEKRLELARRMGEIQVENEQLQEELVKSQAELQVKKQEKENLDEQEQLYDKTFEDAKNVLERVEQQLNHFRADLELFKKEVSMNVTDSNRLRNEHHRVCASIENINLHLSKQAENTKRYENEIKEWMFKKDECEQSLVANEAKILEFFEKISAIQHQCEAETERNEVLGRDVHELDKKFHQAQTRKEMLEEIEKSARQSTEEITGLLEADERDALLSFSHLLEVQPGFEAALETILGKFSSALITDKKELALKLVKIVSAREDASLNLLTTQMQDYISSVALDQSFEHELIISPACEKISAKDTKFQSLVETFLRNVYLVEELNEQSMSALWDYANERKFIAKDGASLGPHRRIVLAKKQVALEENAFRRTREIQDLKQSLVESETRLLTLISEREEVNQRLQALRAQRDEFETEYMDAKIQKESFESLRQGMIDRLQSYQSELNRIDEDRRRMDDDSAQAIQQKTMFEVQIIRKEDKHMRILVQQKYLQQQVTRFEIAKTNALKEYADRKAQFDHFKERKRHLTETIQILNDTQKRDKERIENLRAEKQNNVERDKTLSKADEEIKTLQSTLYEEARVIENRLEKISEQRNLVEQVIREITFKVEETQELQRKLENELHQIEKKSMDLGYAINQLYDRILQAYKINLREINAADFPLSDEEYTEVYARVETLRNRVESMGTVNLLAIEEYDELKVRFDYLDGQQKDLELAREELMTAIRKINKTTKGLFEETFQSVQVAFGEYYSTLFRGGEAKLVLVDESNPLESGVEIIVRPPGKKLQHISLLSGGEKAMTALALMFALFKIKPSPFCVMDEVDAPLDEANIDRFLHVLQDFLKMSQFILVTHSRKTIAMGDSLYGVTMQEAGVSKIVSVKVHNDGDNAFHSLDSETQKPQLETVKS
jgi:chromosome segregation protein